MNKRKILTYVLWLYVLTFGSASLFFLSGLGSNMPLLSIFMTVYMFFPLVTVFIVQKWIYKEAVARPLLFTGRLNWWWPAAAIFPLLLVGLTALVAVLFPGVTLDLGMEGYIDMLDTGTAAAMNDLFEMLPFHPLWLLLGQAIIGGVTINAIFAFGEEVGWRGFLLREFRELGFWKASLLIGVIWGPWHAPLTLFAGHNYPSTPIFGVFMMTVFCMLVSPILSFITIKSRSIFPAAFFHGVINGGTSLGIIIVAGGNPELLNGLTGLAGFIVLLAVNVIIFICTRSTINHDYKAAFAQSEHRLK
ncbi:CPBP family intramembrane metalloprotease [Virgibacillus sp. NKC19-3]|uniref:CPBP family intramembrane glutamic endopeptidase n=1 Tax=Virgibacillus saliphilus TaxID=2831674 RepID=UPI001C9B281F|nr:CPBP family intramembrane glutamic endopeptidase [Virgibacillus sp. NKC19-3]MBY7144987.1 CPBP family intramembrane metalloprotease [Virgibacillus sp. NKC19-3]